MRSFNLPAYRLPLSAMESIQDCTSAMVEASHGKLEPQPHVPHLTLLRQSFFGGRVGLDIPTQYDVLKEFIDAEPTEYSLNVKGIENTTKSITKAAILAIILNDPSGKYTEEYTTIRSKVPQRIRGNVGVNTPHITIGKVEDVSLVTPELLEVGERALPSVIDFSQLLFSQAIKDHHEQVKNL